jgi:hypothetical protein
MRGVVEHYSKRVRVLGWSLDWYPHVETVGSLVELQFRIAA